MIKLKSSMFIMKKDLSGDIISQTKQDYNLIADDFSRTRENIWEETRFLFEDIKQGEKVLDLGCGSGRYYPLIKDKKADYFGIDNSEKLIEIARNKYPGAGFQVMDVLKLSFPDNYFDKVYSIAVFHHIPSKELRIRFLKEIKKVLKPKGMLILTVWKFHRLKDYYRLIKYTIQKLIGKTDWDFKDFAEPWADKAERYYHWFSRREIKRLTKEAGFKVKKAGIIKNSRGNRRNIYLIAEKPS